jgi:hypothetical protein
MSLALIAGERLKASEAERERMLKRVGAGIAVLLVHIVILLALLTAGHLGGFLRKTEPKEVVLLFPPPPPVQTRPRTAPQFIPPVIRVPVEVPPPSAITLPAPRTNETTKNTDVMEALGRELACGAGPYEHLSQAERETCKRQPWKFKKTNKGVIVLDVPEKPLLGEEPASGAEEQLHVQQTTDPCLAAGNTHSECIHKTIFGR